MFKKRGNNNKKVDLNKEAEHIEVANLQELPQEGPAELSQEVLSNIARTPLGRHRAKGNLITLQTMELNELKQEKVSKREYVEVAKEEISDCLNEIRKLKQSEMVTSQEYEQVPPKMVQTTLIEEQHNLKSYDSEGYEDEQLLEVRQDLEGGLSPEREEDPYHQDYEDQLIRRTLTKHNYDRVKMKGGVNLTDLKALEARDKVLEKIQKVSAKKIENTIKRDLEQKKKQHDQLIQGIRLKKGGIEREQKEIDRKERRLTELKAEFERVNKVIEYLYYYGDKVQAFEVGSILRQIKEKEREGYICQLQDVS